MKRAMATFLAVVVVPYLVLVAAAWLFQRRLTYLPSHDVPTPAEVGLSRVDAVAFPTSDGLTLAAWFVPVAGPRATVIVFNGNAGHRAYRAPLAVALARHGIQTLLFDYRGYGGNAGVASEAGLARDARAAVDYLLTRRDVDPNRVVYFGESLGGSVAVELAVERPPRALVVRSAFSSLADVARYHYPFLPVRWLLKERHPTVELIRRVSCPTLVIAGDADTIVPVSQTRQVYDAAAGPKRLVIIEGADHNDFDLLAGETLVKAVAEFVNAVDGGKTSGVVSAENRGGKPHPRSSLELLK
jgi:fermentation-respiration switch protein FrsA (DUF1100 family)